MTLATLTYVTAVLAVALTPIFVAWVVVRKKKSGREMKVRTRKTSAVRHRAIYLEKI